MILLNYKKTLKSTPQVQGKNIKIWSVKKDEFIRINLVEFSGRLQEHLHPDADHSFIVLEGEMITKVAGKEHLMGKGDFICIPKNVPHGYMSQTEKSIFVSMDAPYYDPSKTVVL